MKQTHAKLHLYEMLTCQKVIISTKTDPFKVLIKGEWILAVEATFSAAEFWGLRDAFLLSGIK